MSLFLCASIPRAGPLSSAASSSPSWRLWLVTPGLGLILLVFTTFFLFFFRDPERPVSAPPRRRAVTGGWPGHGGRTVDGSGVSLRSWKQVSIFLSPMDVHINRVPVAAGDAVECQPGRFMPAYRSDAGELNEFTEVTIDQAGRPMSCGRLSASWPGGSCAAQRRATRRGGRSNRGDEVRIANGHVPSESMPSCRRLSARRSYSRRLGPGDAAGTVRSGARRDAAQVSLVH